MFHRAVVATDTSLLTAETRSSRVHEIRQIRRRRILKMSGEEL